MTAQEEQTRTLETRWQEIDVDGVRTNYREAGSGPAVVFFHGGEWGSGGGHTWPQEMFDVLGPAHRVVAFDRLGQGFTDNPRDDAGYRMSAVISHAVAFIRKLGISDATLVGQSRGGYVASKIAKDYPELAKRLVVINSASISVRYPAEPVPGTLTYEVYRRQQTGEVAHDAAIMSATQDHMTDEWLKIRTEVEQLDKSVEARAAHQRVWTEMYREFEIDKSDLLKWMIGGGLTKPVLLIWGVGDPTTTIRDGVDLFEVLTPHNPHLRAKFINQAGHWPHREYPQEVAEEILAFIDRN
jgi:2-hydroxy-6-oxonona-2,4-dienedioate hydrolase